MLACFCPLLHFDRTQSLLCNVARCSSLKSIYVKLICISSLCIYIPPLICHIHLLDTCTPAYCFAALHLNPPSSFSNCPLCLLTRFADSLYNNARRNATPNEFVPKDSANAAMPHFLCPSALWKGLKCVAFVKPASCCRLLNMPHLSLLWPCKAFLHALFSLRLESLIELALIKSISIRYRRASASQVMSLVLDRLLLL